MHEQVRQRVVVEPEERNRLDGARRERSRSEGEVAAGVGRDLNGVGRHPPRREDASRSPSPSRSPRSTLSEGSGTDGNAVGCPKANPPAPLFDQITGTDDVGGLDNRTTIWVPASTSASPSPSTSPTAKPRGMLVAGGPPVVRIWPPTKLNTPALRSMRMVPPLTADKPMSDTRSSKPSPFRSTSLAVSRVKASAGIATLAKLPWPSLTRTPSATSRSWSPSPSTSPAASTRAATGIGLSRI